MMLSNTKKTRFKLTVYNDVFMMLMAFVAVYNGMESLASACVGGILTITTAYIGGNSYRDSNG